MCIAEKQHSWLSCIPCCVQPPHVVQEFNFLIGFLAGRSRKGTLGSSPPARHLFTTTMTLNEHYYLAKFLSQADILCREVELSLRHYMMMILVMRGFNTSFPPLTTTLTLEDEDLTVSTKPKKSSTNSLGRFGWSMKHVETWDRKGFDVDRMEKMFKWIAVDGMCLELGVYDFIAGPLHRLNLVGFHVFVFVAIEH